MISDHDLNEALDRIARTRDGDLLYRYLQKRLMGVCLSADMGALQSDNGERKFAAELMGRMAQGIKESSSVGPDRAITFALAEPRSVARPGRGPGRRVTGAEPGTE